jgi:hypothetical protein
VSFCECRFDRRVRSHLMALLIEPLRDPDLVVHFGDAGHSSGLSLRFVFLRPGPHFNGKVPCVDPRAVDERVFDFLLQI